MQSRDQQRLEHILDYCEDIEKLVAKLEGSFEAFSAARDAQHAMSFCILQIGELVGHFSDEFKEVNSVIPWHKIRGMRNYVAHEYGTIDLDVGQLTDSPFQQFLLLDGIASASLTTATNGIEQGHGA